jgi:hypothetical protein
VIDAALSWADRGFTVFPIEPRGKKPLGSLVPHGLKEASRDPGVIREWWRRKPKANIGIVVGGGHFVLDLDDAEAVSWFANACGRHGGAPKTLTVRTSRGYHVFFTCGVEVPNSAGRLAPGVDVRGEGGYVVAAPSVHPSGHVYTIARDLPIAETPKWLVDEAMPPPVRPPVIVARGPTSALRSETARLRGVASILALVANAQEGERNSLFFWGAKRLAEKVNEGLIGHNEAKALICAAAHRAGLYEVEIEATARSGFGGSRP